MSLTAYCLSLLEKDMEQLKGVQAACALLPMACPFPAPHSQPSIVQAPCKALGNVQPLRFPCAAGTCCSCSCVLQGDVNHQVHNS